MGVGPYVITTIVCTGVLLQADIVIVAHWTYIYQQGTDFVLCAGQYDSFIVYRTIYYYSVIKS